MHLVEDGWRESTKRQKIAGVVRVGHSSSAHLSITAPQIQAIRTPSPLNP